MLSSQVQQECEYAVSLGRPHFVRPTYWEIPLPEAPERGLPSEALKRLHFQLLPLRVEEVTRPTEPVLRPAPRGTPLQLLSGRLLGYIVAAIAVAAVLWRLFGR